MLSFFPNLYPDELLYSALARYHIRSGNKSFRQTDIELFGFHSQQVCRVTLTNNLNYLVNNLPLLSAQTVDNFLQNYTLYPFYATFLTPQEVWLLKDSMRKKLNASILEIAKVARNSIGESQKFLKFCPLCLEEDIQKYGEAYWHRMHQIPGVVVCSTHGVLLQNSSVPIEAKGIHYHAASPENCQLKTQKISRTAPSVKNILILVQEIGWLINSNIVFKGLGWLRNQYKSYLVNQKFMVLLPGGKFRFNETSFSDAIFNFYGQEILEIINPNFIKSPVNFCSMSLLTCDINPVIDRMTHILMIKFLANSLEEFFK
ncbi:TniQ family protein [Scytonema sp. PCC 10023]|uniref:TnsD family Tn7-like transposition protein n=1 Tax=Scytonema sp. PCC 10023 TaxID=1680591 RepID=UPI0039C68245